jgi:hypothetical protein
LVLLSACASGEQQGQDCPRSCALGEQRCGTETAVQTCVASRVDGCPEWSEAVNCRGGSACFDGACDESCLHACVPGEVSCANGGVRQCGDDDGDGCRDWLDPDRCPDDNICDEGLCISLGCEDECAVGSSECIEGGARTCEQTEACAVWTTAEPCPDGQMCAEGACQVTCEDECTAGARRCEAGGFSICEALPDGCLAWSVVTVCGQNERCDDGACVPESAECTDGCVMDGELVCDGDAFRRCGQFDEDPCVELSEPVECGPLQVCMGGVCLDTCRDECEAEATRCEGEAQVVCVNDDGDPCLEWGDPVACEPGNRCDDGACVPSVEPCEDACADGTRRCGEGGVQICGDFDPDDCFEWSAAEPCAAGNVCQGAGDCVPDCVDECIPEERRCSNNGVSTCGNFDADHCQEFGPPSACPNGQVCSDGVCNIECADECADGQTACGPEGEQRCGNFDADACLDWSSPTPCGPGEGCVNAQCGAICQDACNAGAQRCEGVRLSTCADGDGDGCVEWGPAVACPQGEHCFEDECIPLPLEDAYINEFLYDAPGADQSEVFIELVGPPGLNLDDLRIIGVNGANGQTYGEVQLMGAMPADGVFLIAHPDANAALRAEADLFDNQADLQNGPDNVILVRGAVFIDNVGYGNFGGGDVFVGQGQPAAEPENGESLQRVMRSNNNRADWSSAIPTPGVAVCMDACDAGTQRCVGDVAQDCVDGPAGCRVWTDSADCAAMGQQCMAGGCVP